MKGTFIQTDADNKRMKGKFFVKRPGRFRFDYSLPSKQIIVSDGENLAIQDLDLNNEDRVSLDQTPFRLLLRKDVDLCATLRSWKSSRPTISSFSLGRQGSEFSRPDKTVPGDQAERWN